MLAILLCLLAPAQEPSEELLDAVDDLFEPEAAPAPRPVVEPPKGVQSGLTANGIRVVDGYVFRLPRSLYDRAIHDFPWVSKMGSYTLEYGPRGTAGFRVSGVKKGNILHQLGVHNGDLIRKVNGFALTSRAAAFNLWMSSKKDERFVVQLTRKNGETRRFVYVVEDH